MALNDLTKRMTPYETWGTVDLDSRLKQAVTWSGITTLITLVALLCLPYLLMVSHSEFFLLLRTPLQGLLFLCWQYQRTLVIFNLATLGVYGLLWFVTQQLQVSRLAWLRVAYAEAIVGALNGFILLLCSAVTLEARAIRLALEYVGPMIAADAHTQLRGVRPQARGDVRAVRARTDAAADDRARRGDLVSTLARGMRENKLVEIEYQKEMDAQASTRIVEPYSLERPDAELVRAHVGPHERRRAFVPAHRTRSAKLTREKFEPREGFEPTKLRGARRARGSSYTAEIAATRSSASAAPKLADGTALARDPGRERRVARERDPLQARRSSRARARGICAAALRARAPRAREGARRRAASRAGIAGALASRGKPCFPRGPPSSCGRALGRRHRCRRERGPGFATGARGAATWG